MHYKKTQTSGTNSFDALRATLGGRDSWNLPKVGRHSDIMFAQLEQLSGSKLSQFSKGLAATFGATPWKSRQQQESGDIIGLALDSLRQEWMRGVESYIKQVIKNQVGGDTSLGGGSGRSSKGQIIADFTALLNADAARNM